MVTSAYCSLISSLIVRGSLPMHALIVTKTSFSKSSLSTAALIGTGLLLGVSGHVFAQNTVSDADTQETMVVVGSRTPTQISQIPGAVWVIDKEMLQQQTRNGADLKTALGRLVPG